jgi:hypothetical protein
MFSVKNVESVKAIGLSALVAKQEGKDVSRP